MQFFMLKKSHLIELKLFKTKGLCTLSPKFSHVKK